MFYSYKDGISTQVCSSTEITDLVHNTVKYYEELVTELRERNKELYRFRAVMAVLVITFILSKHLPHP